MIIRTIRDIFTNEVDTIYIDEEKAFHRAQRVPATGDAPLREPPTTVTSARNRCSISTIWTRKSPRSIAARCRSRPAARSSSTRPRRLVAIDVNSGSFRTDESAEETAYQMNINAAKEIARQIRLRDLGGVIVNDFIDMRKEKNRRGVERALRDATKRDRARTKILKTSPFGLIEMTRQRIRTNPKNSAYSQCPSCTGTGVVKTPESMSLEVIRLLIVAAQRPAIAKVAVTVAENVADYLNNRKRHELARLESEGSMLIQVLAAKGVPPEHLVLECRDAEDREVKLGKV